MKHEAGKSKVVKPRESLGETLVVSRQTSEPCRPCKATFNHPSARQKDETTLRLGVFNDFQADAMTFGRLRCSVAGIALINISQLHRLSREFLHRRRELLHLIAILLIGRSDMQREQFSKGIDRRMNFAPLAAFGPGCASHPEFVRL